MEEWWLSLTLFEKVLWAIAVPASVVFLAQMVMTFAGMDGDGIDADFSGDLHTDGGAHGGHHGDHDVAPFQVFTLRNFINFFLGFSWTGIALAPVINSKLVVIFCSVLSGTALVAVTMFIFYSLSKATQSGNINMKNALDKSGQVYLTIPARRGGVGKVQMQVQGNLRDFEAVTEGDTIPTGQSVKVVSVGENNILVVTKI